MDQNWQFQHALMDQRAFGGRVGLGWAGRRSAGQGGLPTTLYRIGWALAAAAFKLGGWLRFLRLPSVLRACRDCGPAVRWSCGFCGCMAAYLLALGGWSSGANKQLTAAHDLPPHLGAWPSFLHRNPATMPSKQHHGARTARPCPPALPANPKPKIDGRRPADPPICVFAPHVLC
jgi:hypothetical protein